MSNWFWTMLSAHKTTIKQNIIDIRMQYNIIHDICNILNISYTSSASALPYLCITLSRKVGVYQAPDGWVISQSQKLRLRPGRKSSQLGGLLMVKRCTLYVQSRGVGWRFDVKVYAWSVRFHAGWYLLVHQSRLCRFTNWDCGVPYAAIKRWSVSTLLETVRFTASDVSRWRPEEVSSAVIKTGRQPWRSLPDI